jgi:biopolymer transport protein TolQ
MGEGFTPDSLNPVSLFLHADWVVRAVMIGLIVASLWSWAVILDKLFRFSALTQAADEFEDGVVGSGRSLEELAARAGDNPAQPMPRLLVAALKEWRESQRRGPISEAQGSFLIDRIDRTLDTIISREARRMENGLGVLAVTATASPFVGLFGTVWGIYHALLAIGATGESSIDQVAGPVGESLIMTAFGMFVAIPAVLGYNALTRSNKGIVSRLRRFAHGLHAYFVTGTRLSSAKRGGLRLAAGSN